MSENSSTAMKTVVMLTADQKIDRRILLQAGSLRSAGWHVTIVAMPGGSHEKEDDEWIIRLGKTTRRAQRPNFLLQAYRFLRDQMPLSNVWLPFLRQVFGRYWIDLEKFYQELFYGIVHGLNADVIVAHDLPMLPVAARLAQEKSCRLIYDSHELFCEQELADWEKRKWQEIEARHIRKCDAVITVNPSIAGELERRYDIDNVNVIYNAERPHQCSQPERIFHLKFGLDNQKKVLLLQGALSDGRHIEELVAAMDEVTNSEVVLVLLGDGIMRSRLSRIVRKKKLEARVLFHPSVPQSELLRYTTCADVGIIPYNATCLNNLYCTPNKLFEFIAAGVPVISTDLPELRALVGDTSAGLVGSTHDSAAIASLIDRFFSHESFLSECKENVLKLRERVNWDGEASKLLAIYESLSG